MTRLLSVPTISCDHCRRAIEGAVAEVPGVTSVTVDVPTRVVTVEGSASDDAIVAAVGEAGYEVAEIH